MLYQARKGTPIAFFAPRGQSKSGEKKLNICGTLFET
jgi:hypothetical protein